MEAAFVSNKLEFVMALKIAVLPGDGIGKEIVVEALKVLEVLNRNFSLDA